MIISDCVVGRICSVHTEEQEELRNIFHSVVTSVFNGTAHSAMFSVQGAPLSLYLYSIPTQ